MLPTLRVITNNLSYGNVEEALSISCFHPWHLPCNIIALGDGGYRLDKPDDVLISTQTTIINIVTAAEHKSANETQYFPVHARFRATRKMLDTGP